MKIEMYNGLPIVLFRYHLKERQYAKRNSFSQWVFYNHFYTDEVEEIGLIIDRTNGRPRRIYGVGGILGIDIMIESHP